MSVEAQAIFMLKKAYKKMLAASNQGHSSHWDPKGTGGLNCPECIRADKLREEGVKYYEQAIFLLDPE